MEYPFKDLLPLDEVLEREGYYKDWTHLDPEVFYSLTQISEYIKTKGFGVDVRLLIAQLAEHFGLKTSQMNEIERIFNDVMKELSKDKEFYSLPEIAGARGGFGTLGARLDDTTAQLAHKVEKGENESITWGMADQHFREQVSGGSVAIVGVDSVNSANIVAKAVTFQKTDSLIDELMGVAKHTPNWIVGQFDTGQINELAKVAIVDTQYYDLDTDFHVDFKSSGDIHYVVAFYASNLGFTGAYTPYHEGSVVIPKQANRKVRISVKYKDSRFVTAENIKPLKDSVTLYRNTEKSVHALNSRLREVEGVGNVPSYWQSHLDAKIDEINTLQKQIGYNGSSFAFITDTHWNDNSQNSPFLLKQIMDKCKIPYYFDGGDMAANPLNVPKALHLDELKRVKEAFETLKGRCLQAIGNHDDNSINNKYSMTVPDNEMYDLIYRDNSRFQQIKSGSKGS